LLAGVVGVGLWAASNVVPMVWQDWGNWVFDHEVCDETATVKDYLAGKANEITRYVEGWLRLTPVAKVSIPKTSGPHTGRPSVQPPALSENTLIGRISIPRLHLSAIVREGVGRNTLGLAVGHIPGTALPGQSGNVGVAGHRDTLFLGLRDIKANDVVQFETLEGNFFYQVTSTEIVKPRNVSVLNAGQYAELTLVTCYPFTYIGSAPDRFIVKAREVSRGPVGEGLSANAKEDLRRDAETAVAPEEARVAARSGEVGFEVARHHSQTLAPGISIGIDDTDVTGQRVNGWMWIMPDRRTIWLRDQRTQDPVIFYGHHDGKRRELLITKVTSRSATGYFLMPGE